MRQKIAASWLLARLPVISDAPRETRFTRLIIVTRFHKFLCDLMSPLFKSPFPASVRKEMR